MIKALAKLMSKGGLQRYTLKYYSPDADAAWTIDDLCLSDPSLQVVYNRSYEVNGEKVEEDYWLHLSPEDAAAIGSILTAWAKSHGEV